MPGLIINPIEIIESISFIKEIPTEGNSPLYVIASDDKNYYAKKADFDFPRVETINELICAGFLKCWDMHIPNYCLMIMPYDIFKGKVSSRYKPKDFEDYFFASEEVLEKIDVEPFVKNITVDQFKDFYNPFDFLKIGCFDLWVGNRDRKPKNPNILFSRKDNKYLIHPIDHTAAFDGIPHHKMVTAGRLDIPPDSSILSSSLSREFVRHYGRGFIVELERNILTCMKNTMLHIDVIFDQVPSTWGFSKGARKNLKTILGDDARNSKVVERFKSFLN